MNGDEDGLVIDAHALHRATYQTTCLLPCPFCGREPFASERRVASADGRMRYQARITCTNDTGHGDGDGLSCHAFVFYNAFDLDEARAGVRARWNRRGGRLPFPEEARASADTRERQGAGEPKAKAGRR